MTTYLRHRPPAWFWVVAIVILLWAAMGCYACYQQFRLGAEAMGPATDYDRGIYAALPVWYNWLYAVAVGSGLLGAIALLMRSAVARLLFIISLVAVIAQFGYLFATTDIVTVKGAAATLIFPIVIVLIAVGEIWFAGHSRQRGWIS